MKKAVFFVCVTAFWAWAFGAALAQSPPLSEGEPPSVKAGDRPPFLPPVSPQSVSGAAKAFPVVKRVSTGVFDVGGCRLSKAEGWVRFDAVVNMDRGLLEYLIVGDAGKLHESLLKTSVDPYALQIALLLIGLEGSQHPLGAQGERRSPTGDRVTVRVHWTDSSGAHEVPLEQWIHLKGKPLDDVPWVFTGSMVVDGAFMAEVEKSIVAVYHDPVAMIDHTLDEGADDEVWMVNEKAVPPIGTPVEVVIRRTGAQ
uniref:Uncharacterized protein n=1 Tax=Desulfacinum infernum TaxID=35837 RepID=A0A832A1I7_9BACT